MSNILTKSGSLYLGVVIDMYARKVVGFVLAFLTWQLGLFGTLNGNCY